jgi:hypothetical protein
VDESFTFEYDGVERWLPVVGYEGLYEVSSLGRVRSLDRIVRVANRWGGTGPRLYRGRLLKPLRGPCDYPFVALCDSEQRKRPIHQIVAAAFIGPCPEGMEVCHGPGGKMDNRPENLSYGTHQKNMGPDKARDGTVLFGETHNLAKLTEAIVIGCRQRHAAGEEAAALAREFGVSASAMGFAILGKRWSHLPDPGTARQRGGLNSDKTHCPAGHPYSGDNLYVAPSGDRMCRTCRNASTRKRRALKREGQRAGRS